MQKFLSRSARPDRTGKQFQNKYDAEKHIYLPKRNYQISMRCSHNIHIAHVCFTHNNQITFNSKLQYNGTADVLLIIVVKGHKGEGSFTAIKF